MFVGNISQDKVDYAMVRSIKDIGHVMGKKVIAESVETEGVLEQAARDRRRLRAGLRRRRAAPRSRRSVRRQRRRPAGLTQPGPRDSGRAVVRASAAGRLALINRLVNIARMPRATPSPAHVRQPATRRPGRPAGGDAAVRDALLEARTARCSWRAASRRCRSAAASRRRPAPRPAMIHYYFGDKLGLYRAMLDEAMRAGRRRHCSAP